MKKKRLVPVLAFLLALSLLGGCGAPTGAEKMPEAAPSGPALTIETMQTIGDVIANREKGDEQSATYDNKFVYVFNYGGKIYRVVAPMSADLYDTIMALDIFDENYQEELQKLVAPLKIEKRENLSEMIPAQEELDKLIGKTGAELFAEGWESNGFYLDEMLLFLTNGMFDFTASFDGKYDGSDEVPDDFDEHAFFGPLTVKSVVYTHLGDATNVD